MTDLIPLVEQWGRIQKSLSHVTGLSLTTLGRGGKILTESGDIHLCRLLSEGAGGEGPCRDSCHRMAEQARRENTTIFFRCRAGLQCFASPIRIDGRPVATVLGGRILEKAPDPAFYQDLARRCGLPESRVMKAVAELMLDNRRTLSQTAEMVEKTADILFSSAYHHNRTQKKLALMTSLFHLGSDLNPEKDPHEIYALIVNTVSVMFDVEGACLLLHHPGRDLFRLVTAFGTAEKHCLRLELQPDNGLVGEVVLLREPRCSNDLHQFRRSGFPEETRSVTLFPILFGETVGGLLAILNTPIEPEAEKLIFAFCNQVSTALQNTVLRQELAAKIEDANLMVQFHERLKSALDRDSLLETIFDEATRMTRAEQSSLMIYNRKTNELIVKLARGEHSPGILNVSLGPGEGFAGKVAQRGRPLVVTDLEKDRRIGRQGRSRYRSKSFLIVPIMVNSRLVGVINLADKAQGVFSRGDLDGLMSFLTCSAIALQRSELYLKARHLQKISTTDHLTQLLNRRYFHKRSLEEIMRAQRYNSPLSLAILDIDDFKKYNDRHGHLAGDDLLVGISRTLRESVRNIDVVSRFGGEEFAILSPHTRAEEALAVAERVRVAVESHPFPLKTHQPLGYVSFSAGVASYPDQAGGLQELLSNADQALYTAKRAGKNRVILYHNS